MPLRALRGDLIKEKFNFPRPHYFSEASAKDLNELNRIRRIVHFRDGEKISFVLQGVEGFYYLHEGYVKVICERESEVDSVRIAGPYDLIGFARWYDFKNIYGAVALAPVAASFFPKDDFLGLIGGNYLASEVNRWLMNILVVQEERITALKQSAAKARVACTLNVLYRQFGNAIGGNQNANSAPVDRKTLADLAGVAIEVLSRTLKEFERDGIIERKGRTIIVRDKEALKRAARSE